MKPHIPLMQKKLAELLEIEENQISIKAKTMEEQDSIGERKAIATQSIVIQAFGRVGNYFYSNRKNMEKMLTNVEKINWSRNAVQWYMRAVGKNGRIITNKKAAMLIANVLKQQIGIPLTQEEMHAEEALKKMIKE